MYKNHTSPTAHPSYSPVSERPTTRSQKKLGPFNSKRVKCAYCVRLGAKIWLDRNVAELPLRLRVLPALREMTTAIMGKVS